jgi:signal peptidase I
MTIDFEFILLALTLFSAAVILLDNVVFASKRINIVPPPKVPLLVDYSRSFFPVFLIVLLLRSFVFEPFRIPSGSLEPTLLIGDLIMVSKFSYGVRLPVIHSKVLKTGEPARGDITVFRKPGEESQHYIKRIVGVPGDTLSYVDKVLYVNGEPAKQTWLADKFIKAEERTHWPVTLEEEDLMGVKHNIYQSSLVPAVDFENVVVPEGHYYAMGDNRDDSADSRYWGFVPETHLVGKALFVWMSYDIDKWRIRWRRIFNPIH